MKLHRYIQNTGGDITVTSPRARSLLHDENIGVFLPAEENMNI